jgi:VCBS repeat-containing protein
VIPGPGPSTNGVKGGILANDFDVEGDAFTAVLVSTVSHGKLSLNDNGSFSYTPDPDFNGTDSFTYRASDGSATSAVATVTITVTPVPDQPAIVSQRMVPDGFQLRIIGIDAPACVIWASTDLQNWTPISTNSAFFGSLTFTDPTAANYSMRFYRVCGANTNGN